jgi:hypothetical protein
MISTTVVNVEVVVIKMKYVQEVVVQLIALLVKLRVMVGVRTYRAISETVVNVEMVAMQMKYAQEDVVLYPAQMVKLLVMVGVQI